MVALNKEQILEKIKELKRTRVFIEIDGIYREVPKATCQKCGTCCLDSPDIFYIEYVNIYRILKNKLQNKQKYVIRKSVEYTFLEMVAPNLSLYCPLYENKSCIIYENRFLQCRIWGHLSLKEYETNLVQSRDKIEIGKDFYKIAGIEEHEPFVVPYCDKVKFNKPMDSYKISNWSRKISMLELSSLDYRETPFLVAFPTNLLLTIFGVQRFQDIKLKVAQEYIANNRKTGQFYNKVLEEALTYEF